MGKSRIKKNKHSRNNPIGVLPVDGNGEENSVNHDAVYEMDNCGKKLSRSSVQSLLKQAQSSSTEDRDCACNALAGLIRNGIDAKVALQEDTIKVLGPLLVDPNSAVRDSALGALYNLIAIGGEQAVKLAMEQDVMTPLAALLKKIQSSWKPTKTLDKTNKAMTSTFIEAVQLLWILCESSGIAVDIFHRENLLLMLSQFLDINTFGTKVVSVVAQCLSTTTEDQGNLDFFISLAKEIKQKLIEPDYSTPLIRTLGVGIALNLNNGIINQNLIISIETIVNILFQTLQEDHRKAASHLMDYLPLAEKDEEELEDAMDSDLTDEEKYKEALGSLEDLLSAQIRALEILTNLCCSADDSDDDYEDLDQDESNSEESMNPDETGIEETNSDLAPELKQSLIDTDIFQLVLSKANLPAENVCQSLKSDSTGKTLLNRYHTLQCRAFLCLNNLVMSLEVENMGGPKELFDVWCKLGVVAFQGHGESADLLESATTSMRAIIHKLSCHHTDVVHLLRAEDIGALCEATKNCQEPVSKINLIQIIGILGSMAAGVDPPVIESRAEIVKVIGQILLDIVCKDQDLWIVAEALDAIFDVFKEDHVDFIAIDIKLVEGLKAIAANLKHRIHSQRRSLGTHLAVVMTAKDNLTRFIKYKAKQRITSR